MPKFKLHTSNVIYLSICALGMLAFVLVGIFPNLSSLNQLDENIAQLKQKVQAQELLHPIYVELIKKAQQKTPAGLPLPRSSKIAEKDISGLNEIFASIAKESDVAFENAMPDPRSYLEETGRLTMNVTYSGDFFNFRKLIMNICKIPYLISIERLQIKIEGKAKSILIKLSLDQT